MRPNIVFGARGGGGAGGGIRRERRSVEGESHARDVVSSNDCVLTPRSLAFDTHREPSPRIDRTARQWEASAEFSARPRVGTDRSEVHHARAVIAFRTLLSLHVIRPIRLHLGSLYSLHLGRLYLLCPSILVSPPTLCTSTRTLSALYLSLISCPTLTAGPAPTIYCIAHVRSFVACLRARLLRTQTRVPCLRRSLAWPSLLSVSARMKSSKIVTASPFCPLRPLAFDAPSPAYPQTPLYRRLTSRRP